jgi:hypothetical protein
MEARKQFKNGPIENKNNNKTQINLIMKQMIQTPLIKTIRQRQHQQ